VTSLQMMEVATGRSERVAAARRGAATGSWKMDSAVFSSVFPCLCGRFTPVILRTRSG
jgi:hypothetical protein